MNEIEVSKLVAMLLVAYPNAKPSAATTELYEMMLVDLDHQTADQAVRGIIGTSRFFPTIAEIREAALEVKHGAVRSGATAYGEVMSAIRQHGRTYGGGPGPAFSDPLIPECIRIWGGSWNAVCDSPDNDPGGRARFIELYDSLAQRGRKATQVSNGLRLPIGETPKQLPNNVVDLLAKVGRTTP